MRGIRDEHGASADHVAEAARRHGLRWQRSTVASIETGKRGLSAEELLLLPAVLSEALRSGGERTWITLGDVLNLEASITDEVIVTPRGFRDLLAGKVPSIADWHRPKLLAQVKEALAPGGQFVRAFKHMRRLWPEIDLLDEELDRSLSRASKGEAEQKAARAIGVSASDVTIVSWRLWGRSLTDERDRLAELDADHADTPRTTQTRRGHITRRLVAQIRQTLDAIGGDDGQR